MTNSWMLTPNARRSPASDSAKTSALKKDAWTAASRAR